MRLDKVTKRYGEKIALENLNLDIEEGKITAVLGESGAGKTTLLNVLAGLLPYEGTVDGAEGGAPVRRENCSYLFQTPKLLPNLTAEGNLKFVLPKEKWGEIPDMLARVGLDGRGKSYPSELSGGEKQRVAIARAFLYPHQVLLMDEPFTALDLSLKKSLIDLFFELWSKSGETVVFVTHDVREAALLSHRAIVLRQGKVIFDAENPALFPRDFFSPPPIENALIHVLTDIENPT